MGWFIGFWLLFCSFCAWLESHEGTMMGRKEAVLASVLCFVFGFGLLTLLVLDKMGI
jgi:hypothetical protein